MVVKYGKDKKERCRRCEGIGTIPTPDSKHNEICPVCGGSGIKKEPKKVDWLSEG